MFKNEKYTWIIFFLKGYSDLSDRVRLYEFILSSDLQRFFRESSIVLASENDCLWLQARCLLGPSICRGARFLELAGIDWQL